MIQSINVESKKNSLCLPEKTNFIKVSDMQWNWVLCTCSNNHKVIQQYKIQYYYPQDKIGFVSFLF